MNQPQRPLLPQGAELAHPPTRSRIYVGLGLAFALTLLPWMEQIRWLVPDFTLMALLYWNIRAPRLAGLGAAFCFGLLTDVARGVLIGLNALAYCTATFVVLLIQRRLEGFDTPRQTLQLAPMLLGKELLVLTIGLVIGRGAVDWRWLAAGVVAALLWPPLAWLVDRASGRAAPGMPTTRRPPL
ncbi:MAG: rod shape-determining protein MreD [Pseudomonadota bacterium]|nr:rod shape-determining protein MreD [Pseudomonadota bacterium]